MQETAGFDYVIVGSGFGGSVSALRLAEKGYKVAVLEAGKRLGAEDFAKTNWNVPKFLWAPRLRCFGIQRLTLLRDVLILSGAGVGGGSLVYANTLPVPKAEVFHGAGWPAGEDWERSLAPYYATAKQMLGANTNPRVTRADQVIQQCAEEMGFGGTWHPTEVAVYFGEAEKTVPDPYFGGRGPERTGCRFCGGCMVGCRYGAKNTLDRNYLYLAEKLGVQVFPETTVDRLEALPGGGGYLLRSHRSTSLLGGGRRTWRAPRVILSAGVMGTLGLLLKARDEGTLPSLPPSLGRRVRTNSEALVGAISRRSDVDLTDGIAITSSVYPDAVTHIEPVRYSRGSDLMGLLATLLTDGGPGLPRQVKFLIECVKHPLDLLRSIIPIGWAKRTILLLTMQTSDNHLRVLRQRRWWWPFSRGLTSRPSDETGKRNPSYIPVANEFARHVARKIEGWPGSAINEVLLDVPTTAHILGGACIGDSPEQAVCDARHQVFGNPGLYVVDGSSVPVNLGVNPSLTITALAEKAMSAVPDSKKAG